MEIEIITFGKIASFIAPQKLDINEATDTNELQCYLEENFPELAMVKYKLAVNKLLVQENSKLKNNDIVAIMPPFSGG